MTRTARAALNLPRWPVLKALCTACLLKRAQSPSHCSLLPSALQGPPGVFVCSRNPDAALQWQGCQAPQERFEGADGRVNFFPG